LHVEVYESAGEMPRLKMPNESLAAQQPAGPFAVAADDPTPGPQNRRARAFEIARANMRAIFKTGSHLIGLCQGPQYLVLQALLDSEQLPYLPALVSGESSGGADVKRTGETSGR